MRDEERLAREEQRDEKSRMNLPEGLHLLDLPQPMRGFRHFISSWFFVDTLGRRVLVDPGPAGTIPLLIERLSEITDGVDLVLLTHIHPDHSGGTGQFCEAFDAKVLVHPKGKKHLLDPERLWRSSIETLGEIAEMYGRPRPLAPGALLDSEEVEGVTILETPGHASHHLSFIVPFRGERLFFVGEAAGLCLPLASSNPLRPWLRPTTPPRFDGTAERESLRKIRQNLQENDILCYAHYGATRQAFRMIGFAGMQLDAWLAVVKEMRDRPDEEIAEHLIARDPLLSDAVAHLPADLLERERIFIRNSIRGLSGYLKSASRVV
ncbi:MAG: MBL fold metallo-hydrolase [Synergistaceae bacterium]|jgi:glyoxylase-like metal-dependent hydrolase (beta-lactamase superfamily II)|nr:MBL fold metallo-hydrolase [Synergistaceae bacterium]